MEIPQVTIKQEKDNFTPAVESNEDYKSEILDLLEIKVEPVKIEPYSHEPEPDNLDQESKLTEEAKIIENDNKYIL